MMSARTMLGLTLLAACLAAAPARGGDEPAPAPPCDVPAYLLATESALPKVTDAVKANQPLNVLVVGSRSSTIPGNEASAYPHGLPGEQTLHVTRAPLPSPPRNCASMETGNSWALRIVLGSWQWNIRPELRSAHPGPPLHWSPTKRYSMRMT